MDALRKSVRTEQTAGKKAGEGERGKKRIEGQREMLFSICRQEARERSGKKARARGRPPQGGLALRRLSGEFP